MAQKRTDKIILLVCKECSKQNYVTTRNKVNMEGKLVIKKFCKNCRKQTEHRESVKLK